MHSINNFYGVKLLLWHIHFHIYFLRKSLHNSNDLIFEKNNVIWENMQDICINDYLLMRVNPVFG